MDEARWSEEAARTRAARLLGTEHAAAADADALRTSLAKASAATEVAATAAAAAEAKATAYAAAKSGAEREVSAANQSEIQVAARELEVRKLEDTVGRSRRDAQEGARSESERQREARIEEAVTAVAEERNAWAMRSREWEDEAVRLGGELEASDEKATNLQQELQEAVAMTRDLVPSGREDEGEVAAPRGRGAELGDGHDATQV